MTLGIIGLGIMMVFISPIIGVSIGAFSGWIVSFVFDETIRNTLFRFGVDINGLSLWQVGATLGFVGSFFKSHLSNSSAK